MSDTQERVAVLWRFYAQHYGKKKLLPVLDELVMDAMADRIVELEASVERVRALHEVFGDWCDRCNCVAPCATLRALEGTP